MESFVEGPSDNSRWPAICHTLTKRSTGRSELAACQSAAASGQQQAIAAVGMAQCLVRLKELESCANVEQQRLVQQGATDRCRITQEHLSKRLHRMADVAEVAVRGDAETKRLSIAATERVHDKSSASHERVQVLRAHLELTAVDSAVWRWRSGAAVAVALMVGKFPLGFSRRRHSRIGSMIRRFMVLVALGFAAQCSRQCLSPCQLDRWQLLRLLVEKSWNAVMHTYHTYNKLKNSDWLSGASVMWRSPEVPLKQLEAGSPEIGSSIVNDPPLASAKANTTGLAATAGTVGCSSSSSRSSSRSSSGSQEEASRRSAGPAPGETPECTCVACSGADRRRRSEPQQPESQPRPLPLQQPLQPLQWQQWEERQQNQHDHQGQEQQLQLLETKLAPWGLAQYAAALEQRGYDAEVLSMLQPGEVEELLGLVACKPGHRVRFRRFFEKCMSQNEQP